MSNLNFTSKRIVSIDIFRALTMFFMIFVNDLWSLTNVPEWLKHKSADVDGIGFSDIIFPAFLFIVGLSIPFAIKARRKKGDNNLFVLKHIVIRTLALIIMGLFMVNFESINEELLSISKYVWEIIMALAIFLVWLYYKPFEQHHKKITIVLQFIGIVLFIYLAVIYKGGTSENIEWMKPHWWGILGLIGWAYLLNSTFYLFFGHRLIFLFIMFILLHLLNVQEFITFAELPTFKIVISASNHVSVTAGMVAGSLLLHYKRLEKENTFLLALFILGFLSLIYGFALRPHWGGFSKIRATPSWTSVCIGISYLSFLGLYIITDKLKFIWWSKPIKAAGTNTLTCYVIPYFIYPLMVVIGVSFPKIISDGNIGIIKSLLFSLGIIGIATLLNKFNIKLKV